MQSSELIVFIVTLIGSSFLAFFSFLVSYFLDYILGRPSSQNPNQKAIFFFWTYFLARKRLEREEPSLYKSLMGSISQGIAPIQKTDGLPVLNNFAIKEVVVAQIVNEGRELFSWELPFGMCSVCTNFWISFFVAICGEIAKYNNIGFDYYDILFIFVVVFYSHYILRKNI